MVMRDAPVQKKVFVEYRKTFPLNREENAKKLIRLITEDMSDGRVLYNKLLNYSKKFVGDYHDKEDIVCHFILNLVDGRALTYRYNINNSIDDKLMRWLYGCVKNLSISFLRNRSIINVHPFPKNEENDYQFVDTYLQKQKQEEPPDKKASKKETNDMISMNLPYLESKYKDMLVQRFFEHASYKEISKTQNIPIGTVKSRLHRAKRRFAGLKEIVALSD